MQKVITVSLNGNAYQLDEDAYAQLALYLDQSARALAGNPDKAEIIADLEQAIGEKCARYLNAHKTVVTGAELRLIIEEMGPVDGDGESTATGGGTAGKAAGTGAQTGGAAAGAAGGGSPRRLYQISEGAIFSGVCNGIAAYFAVDVTLVRAIFVALFLFTGGLALLAYVVLMFILPYASTSEEHAAAHGLPFNARTLVERAKDKYAQFARQQDWRGPRAQWRAEWRRLRAEWRIERRRLRDQWRTPWRTPWRYGAGGAQPTSAAAASPPDSYFAHVLTGTAMAVLGLVFAIVTIGWLLALLSLVTTGALLGWSLPHEIPFWAALIALILLYNAVIWPIRSMRRAAYYSVGPYHSAWIEAWNGIVGLAVLIALAWYGLHHMPEVRALFDQVTHWWREYIGHEDGDWT
jgi:phage shock protein PspC (stress-responsive transcriptional regulator)